MEQHPERITEGIVRKDGSVTPFNAADAIAAVCEIYGHPIPSSWRARLGKHAKELLGDGFDPYTVCAAMYAAIKRARPDLVATFAMELQNARTGQTFVASEWRFALDRANAEARGSIVTRTLRERRWSL